MVAEAYSPPRVCARAAERGMDFGSSLDLTTTDEAGRPWDFSIPEMRAKAKARVTAEEPALLIVRPMRGPFPSWQHVNYQRMDEAAVRKHLTEALEHLKFGLELCVMQQRAGRMFLFEHPVGATSWGTRMMKVGEMRYFYA